MIRKQKSYKWTARHIRSLQAMYNREVRVATDKRDIPLIKRIKKCLFYLSRRTTTNHGTNNARNRYLPFSSEKTTVEGSGDACT